MKFNQKILSIPPYISTSWKNVISLHRREDSKGAVLIISLVNGSTIEVPGMPEELLRSVFLAHQKFVEGEIETKLAPPGVSFPLPFPSDATALMNLPIGIDGAAQSIMQHDSAAADSPSLPPEMLEKIVSITKAIGFENPDSLPKPEPHCNCVHCQIMRSLHGADPSAAPKVETDELVSEEDLRFQEWTIAQATDSLYVVSNPLNRDEQFNVFLGTPIGCTCGEKNCEHVRAVLNS